MAKKNIGVLLAAFALLLGLIGGFVFSSKRMDANQETVQNTEVDSEILAYEQERETLSEDFKETHGTPNLDDESYFGLEYSESFSMEELGMTAEEINALKSYRIRLSGDVEGFAKRAAELLFDSTEGMEIGTPEDYNQTEGMGDPIQCSTVDGSCWIISDAVGSAFRFNGSIPEEEGAVDGEEQIAAYLEALAAGFTGYDGISYSIEKTDCSDLSEEGYPYSEYYVRYAIDGYPVSSARGFTYEPDGGYLYWYGVSSEDQFEIANGWLVDADWGNSSEIYASEQIARKYGSLEEILEQMETALESTNVLYNYYIVEGVRCCYVIGYSDEIGEDGLRELVATPFLEFDVQWYTYYPIVDRWERDENHVIGFNLETGSAYVGNE